MYFESLIWLCQSLHDFLMPRWQYRKYIEIVIVTLYRHLYTKYIWISYNITYKRSLDFGIPGVLQSVGSACPGRLTMRNDSSYLELSTSFTKAIYSMLKYVLHNGDMPYMLLLYDFDLFSSHMSRRETETKMGLMSQVTKESTECLFHHGCPF